MPAFSTPHGASAPFWAPYSVCSEGGRPRCAHSSAVPQGAWVRNSGWGGRWSEGLSQDPLGAAAAPPLLPGSPGGGDAGRTPGFLPPSHPREKFLRGPLRLWVPKITLRGKGGSGGREAGGARSRARGAAGASGERTRGEQGLRGLGHKPVPGVRLAQIPGEPLRLPAPPRESRKPLGGSVSQLVGCTIPGRTV